MVSHSQSLAPEFTAEAMVHLEGDVGELEAGGLAVGVAVFFVGVLAGTQRFFLSHRSGALHLLPASHTPVATVRIDFLPWRRKRG